jgi:hypothetical protein
MLNTAHVVAAWSMPRYTPDDIRTIFATSDDFNQIFEAFEDAVSQKLSDVDLYRRLFWNSALSPDEVCLFGEKLAHEFESLAYDVFMWMASVFEVTYSSYDNFELAMRYFRKAAAASPGEVTPYIEASECYEPDINIPPIDQLLAFLRSGIPKVEEKRPLLEQIAYLYEMTGDEDQGRYYRRLADDIGRSTN